MSSDLSHLPEPAASAWVDLRDALRTIVSDELVAMWAFGGTTSTTDPAHAGDLDTYVVVTERPTASVARSIEDAEERIARDRGIEWDNWYITVDDARVSTPPPHAWRDDRRDTSWALNRSHWRAGRYVLLHGSEPEALVAAPTWDEIQTELSRELEHIERHVVEGDTDGFEATYAILNGSRVLHALATKEVAISKRAAGPWASERLPDRWHPAIRAALRSYDGQATEGDVALLAVEMAPFVAFIREQLPYPEDRPPESQPRWSGY